MVKKTLAFYFLLLLLSLCHAAQRRIGVPVELWCVAKNNADDASLQSALDWVCGPGGADCGPIQQGGPCYDPTDIQNTASFAFNDYFLKHGMSDDSCSFQNSAALTSLNPSFGNCKLPSSSSVSNGNFSNPTTTVGLGPSEDLNGGDQISRIWVWPLITVHMFFVTRRIILG